MDFPIIDPRTGEPVTRSLTAAVLHEDGLVAEAISTALIVLGPAGVELVRRAFPSATVVHLAPAVRRRSTP
jgi:thiamine biosynthesis lipoprotein ApbE